MKTTFLVSHCDSPLLLLTLLLFLFTPPPQILLVSNSIPLGIEKIKYPETLLTFFISGYSKFTRLKIQDGGELKTDTHTFCMNFQKKTKLKKMKKIKHESRTWDLNIGSLDPNVTATNHTQP